MWQGQDKTWMHYLNDIIASDVYSAVFLSTYMKHSRLTRQYMNFLEVIDLQKYKVISRMPKVRIALKNRGETPFIFVVGKN
ncbi:hypothetical protein ACTHGU_10230 [Chitinophagaceae bacterium MMS25-I14]